VDKSELNRKRLKIFQSLIWFFKTGSNAFIKNLLVKQSFMVEVSWIETIRGV